MITAAQLSVIMPRCDGAKWATPLSDAMQEFAINTPMRIAAFCAQLAHESNQLRHTEENLNYSADGLLKTWPKKFTTVSAVQYAHQPTEIANYVYAGILGNGNAESGDGWLYRGGGLIQLTGRQNYADCGAALNLDLEDHPERVRTEPVVAARSAGWFWNSRKLNLLADKDDIKAVTKAVNGPRMLGLAERESYYTVGKALLAV